MQADIIFTITHTFIHVAILTTERRKNLNKEYLRFLKSVRNDKTTFCYR